MVPCTGRQESLHSGPPRQRLIPLPTMYTLYYVSGAFCGGFVVCESFSLFLGSFVPSRGVATQTLTIGIALCCVRLSLLTCFRWLQIRISFSQALNTRVPGRSFLRVSIAPSGCERLCLHPCASQARERFADYGQMFEFSLRRNNRQCAPSP